MQYNIYRIIWNATLMKGAWKGAQLWHRIQHLQPLPIPVLIMKIQYNIYRTILKATMMGACKRAGSVAYWWLWRKWAHTPPPVLLQVRPPSSSHLLHLTKTNTETKTRTKPMTKTKEMLVMLLVAVEQKEAARKLLSSTIYTNQQLCARQLQFLPMQWRFYDPRPFHSQLA